LISSYFIAYSVHLHRLEHAFGIDIGNCIMYGNNTNSLAKGHYCFA